MKSIGKLGSKINCQCLLTQEDRWVLEKNMYVVAQICQRNTLKSNTNKFLNY
jgi:hypothetical protein